MKKIKIFIVFIFMLGICAFNMKLVKAEEIEEQPEVVEVSEEKKSSLAMIFEDKATAIITGIASATTSLGVIVSVINLVSKFLKKKKEEAERALQQAKDVYDSCQAKVYNEMLEFQNEAKALQETMVANVAALKENFDASLNAIKEETNKELAQIKEVVNNATVSFDRSLAELEVQMKNVEGVKSDVVQALKDIRFETELLKTYLLNSKDAVSEGISRKVDQMVKMYEQTKEELKEQRD